MIIKEMVELGYSVSRIAKILGKDKKDVKKEAERYELKKEEFSDDKIDYICELYKGGVSAKNLGIKYSIDKRRVQRWVKERGELRSLEDSHRVTYFNEHKMDRIDTPAKAYWLGFFYADAYNGDLVNTFNITLQGSDIDHVKKIARFFELPEEKVYRHRTKTGIDTSNIKLYSKYLCNKMTELGCPRAKSLIITYPKWLEEGLHSHFIRGLFDGDGCLTLREKQKEWKWSYVGTRDICDEICNIININLDIVRSPYSISKDGKNTYAVEITGNEQILKMCDWLYDGSDEEIRLERKHEKYLGLAKQQGNRCFNKSFNKVNIEIEQPKVNSGFIDKYSAKCLLGPVSKDYYELEGLFSWKVNKNNHFVMISNTQLNDSHINYLSRFESISFHYLSKNNIDILKKCGKVSSTKVKSVILSIEEINYSGNKNKTIRNYINRYKDYKIQDTINDKKEVDIMLSRWSETMGEKYFRDFSGKTKFFLLNDFHEGCENVFIYKDDELISFGVASPVINGYCSYVIGKALAKDYPGLSEFTDIKLYERLFSKYGSFKINMGQAKGGLLFYKKKFLNSTEEEHFDGKITF